MLFLLMESLRIFGIYLRFLATRCVQLVILFPVLPRPHELPEMQGTTQKRPH
jgi:hypothetical protein